MRFTNAYVSCPVCSPTRAGLLTGRYQQRFGHEFNPGPDPEQTFGLPLSERTIADTLKAAGYRTALVGKWHLGSEPEYLPQRRGFDEFFGFLGGAHAYFTPDAKEQNVTGLGPAGAGGARAPIFRGTEPVKEEAYLTDAFGREASAFVARNKDNPYFLYLAFNGVHTPLQAPKKYVERFPNLSGKRQAYAAMLSAVDDAVGQVLAQVKANGQEQDTLVLFISDNGGPPANGSNNTPLSGFKASVLEGGIRVPLFVKWPAKISAGAVRTEPVISLDILPTAAAAAGAKVADGVALEGVDLLPLLTGTSAAAPHERLYWRFGEQWAIREGDFKLRGDRGGAVSLFNLKDDMAEHHDLAVAQPEKVSALKAAWDAWDGELSDPKWKRRQQPVAAAANAGQPKASGPRKRKQQAAAEEAGAKASPADTAKAPATDPGPASKASTSEPGATK